MALNPYVIAQFPLGYGRVSIDPLAGGFGSLENRRAFDEQKRAALVQEAEAERAAKADEALTARQLAETERHNPVYEALLRQQNITNELRRRREASEYLDKKYGFGPEASKIKKIEAREMGLYEPIEGYAPGRAAAAQALTGVPVAPQAAPQTPPQMPAGVQGPAQQSMAQMPPMAAQPPAQMPPARPPMAQMPPQPTPQPKQPLWAMPGAQEAFPYVAKSQMVPPGESREKLGLVEEATREEQAKEAEAFGRGIGLGEREFTVLDKEGHLTRDAAGAGVTAAGLEQMLSGLPPEQRAAEIEKLKGATFNTSTLGKFQEASKQALAKYKATPRRSATYVKTPQQKPVQKPALPQAMPGMMTRQAAEAGFYQGGMESGMGLLERAESSGDPRAEYAAKMTRAMMPQIYENARGDSAAAQEMQWEVYRFHYDRAPMGEPETPVGTGERPSGVGQKTLRFLNNEIRQTTKLALQNMNWRPLLNAEKESGEALDLIARAEKAYKEGRGDKGSFDARLGIAKVVRSVFGARASDYEQDKIWNADGLWTKVQNQMNTWNGKDGAITQQYLHKAKEAMQLVRDRMVRKMEQVRDGLRRPLAMSLSDLRGVPQDVKDNRVEYGLSTMIDINSPMATYQALQQMERTRQAMPQGTGEEEEETLSSKARKALEDLGL